MTDVPPVEQTKAVDVVDTPAVGEPAKSEDTPAVTETPAAVVEQTSAEGAQETPATEEAKPAEAKRPKSPGFLAKLIGPFKDKMTKAPKSPKKEKEKKKEDTETPATEEAPKSEETPVVTDAVEPPKEVSEPVKETETPAAETSVVAEVTEVQKVVEKTKSKFTRRLSARVGDLFRKKSDVPATAKVDENPPKIDEPAPVAPLENPASGTSVPTETPAEPSDPAKTVESAADTPIAAPA